VFHCRDARSSFLRSIRDSREDFIFRGARPGKPLSNMAMLKVLERMGRADLTVHGFRSTFRDWAAEETNFPTEVVEMALAHTVADKVEAAYRRGDLFEKRRKLIEAWAAYCAAPTVGNRSVRNSLPAKNSKWSRRVRGDSI
jgi:integrase